MSDLLNIILEPEQVELLAKLVEAQRSVPEKHDTSLSPPVRQWAIAVRRSCMMLSAKICVFTVATLKSLLIKDY